MRVCLCARERGEGEICKKIRLCFLDCFTSIWAAPPPHEVLVDIVVFSSTAVAL